MVDDTARGRGEKIPETDCGTCGDLGESVDTTRGPAGVCANETCAEEANSCEAKIMDGSVFGCAACFEREIDRRARVATSCVYFNSGHVVVSKWPERSPGTTTTHIRRIFREGTAAYAYL